MIRSQRSPWSARCKGTLEVRGGVLFEPFHRRFRILKFKRMPVWIRQRKTTAYDAS